ncbi:stressosome-associated protein Prli42 [Paenibacillus doosanensis]|nr:stressosome-associated protein Prli42 [Paenibacillus doosanensis]
MRNKLLFKIIVYVMLGCMLLSSILFTVNMFI